MTGEGHPFVGRSRGPRRLRWLALALAVPTLCLGQEATSIPGAGVPGTALPFGVGAKGLTPPPTEYTQYGASIGAGATDNVNFSTNPQSQALGAADVFLDLIRTGSRLQLSALGDFSDIDYLGHTYGNQLLGRFDGLANLLLWAQHLTWVVRDDYGDQQIDPLESLTPVNLQRVNIFSTGPDLRLQPTLSSYIDMQALYSRSTYQTSPFDGQAGTGSVELGHNFSKLSSISLVGEVEELHFDNTLANTNYQIREFYGKYRLQGARTMVDLRAGADQANDTGTWTSSPLLELSLTRNISPFSTATLSGGRDYANAMGSFASLGASPIGGITVGSASQTTANAVHTYGNAALDFHRLRTTFSLFGGWEHEDYDRQSTYNVTHEDVGLTLGRKLTPRLTGNITAEVDRFNYLGDSFMDNVGTAGAGLVYRINPRVVIYGRYDHQFRRSTGTTVGSPGYDENRVFIMIGYYPHSSGTGAMGSGGGGGGGALP
jgi:hypothetical protein